MAQKIQFNVGMDKTEFMTGSREIAQAISSLKGTVTSAGKVMRDSATGYGTALRKSVAATREFETNIQGIKAKLDTLRGSVSAIKETAANFRALGDNILRADDKLKKMRDKLDAMTTDGQGTATKSWEQNQAAIEKATAALNEYNQEQKRLIARRDEHQKYLDTGKNAYNMPLSPDEVESEQGWVKTQTARIQQLQENIDRVTESLQVLKNNQADLERRGENGPSKEYQNLYDAIQKSKAELDAMTQKYNEMKANGAENADKSPEYMRQVQQVQKLEDALRKAEEIKEQVLKPPYLQAWESMTTLTGQISEGFGRLQYAAGMALTAIKNPGQTLDRLLGALTARVGSLLSSLARMAGSAALSFMKNLASSAANAAIQLAKIVSNAVVSGLSSLANAAKNAVINLGRLAMSAAASGLRSIANGAKTAATSLARMTSSAIVGGIKRIASAAGAAGKGLASMVRHNKLADGSMKQSLKTVLKYAFGVRSMFFLFKRLRRAVSDAFTEMAKTTPEVRSALTSLQTALNGLKGSLATAFAPILTAIAPALIYLMNLLTAAMNTIGAFFAAFTGASVFKKAAGGISGTGKAAGGASKKVKELKRELAGFDELNILNGDKNNGGGGGGGGGSGGGMKFLTEAIPSDIKDFVDKVKELWAAGDFKGLGQFIAFKINYALMKARELISWENVEGKISAGVSAVAGIINGLTDPEKGINFGLLGSTFSNGIQTLINTIGLLVQKISFANIGVGIAKFFNGILANEQLFEDIKKGFEDIIGALSDLSTAFLSNFEEGTLAQRIRDTLGDASMWESIGSEVWNVIKLAFNKTGNFLNVLLGGEDKLQEDPDVTRLMRKRPTNITPKYEIDTTIWDSLKETLGNGISSALDSVTGFIESHNASEVISALVKWVVDLKNKAFGDGTGIGRLFGAVFSHMIDGWSVIIEAFSNDAETLGGQLAGAVNACINKAFPEDGGTVATTFNNAVLGALDFVTAFLKNFDEEHVAEIIKGFSDATKWNEIANAAWEAMKLAFSKLGNFLDILLGGEGALDFKIDDSAVDIDEATNEKLALKNGKGDTSVWDDLADRLANGFNSAIESLTNFISGLSVSDAVGALADWIVRFKNGVAWDRVGGLFGVALGTALSAISEAVTTFAANAETDGANLADAMNTLISTAFPDGESTLGTMFSTAVKGTFDFVTAFMEQFNEVTLAKKIRTEVDWDGIAEAAWNAFKTAIGKLGNFLTVLFGGEVDTGKAEDAIDAVERMWDRHDGSQNEGATVNSIGGMIGTGASKAATGILDAITWALGKIDWENLGTEIHNMLVNIQWADIATSLWNAIIAAAQGLGKLLIRALFGESTFNDYGLNEEDADYTSKWMTANELEQRMVQTKNLEAEADLTLGVELDEETLAAVKQAAEEKLNKQEAMMQFGLDPDVNEQEIIELNAAIQQSIDNNEKELQLPFNLEMAAENNPELAAAIEQAKLELTRRMSSVGTDSADGLVDGYSDELEAEAGAIKTATAGIEEPARAGVESNSPSEMFKRIGEDIVAGLVLGLGTLPAALKGIWDNLPEWARTLLGQTTSNLKIAMSGGGNGGGGGATGDVDDNTKIVKKETKEVKKLTKAVKNRGQDIVDVNYEGAGFDTSGDRPKLNVGVQFAPENEEPTDENTNGGLLGWLQTLLDPGVSVEAKIALIQDGWKNFKNWLSDNGVDGNTPIGQLIDLLKNNFDTVAGFLGIDPNSPIGTFLKLILDNAKSLLAFLGIDENTPISTVIKLVLQKFKDLLDFLGIPDNSPIRTIIDLLMGKTDPEADKVLGAGGTSQDAIVKTLLEQGGTWFANGWTLISLAGKALSAITGKTNLEQGGTWVGSAWTVISSAGKTLSAILSSVNLTQGNVWVANAWTAITSVGKTLTTSVSTMLSQGKTWVANAWTALTTGDHSTKTTAELGGNINTGSAAYTTITAKPHAAKTTAQLESDGIKTDSAAFKTITSSSHWSKTTASLIDSGIKVGSAAYKTITSSSHWSKTTASLIDSGIKVASAAYKTIMSVSHDSTTTAELKDGGIKTGSAAYKTMTADDHKAKTTVSIANGNVKKSSKEYKALTAKSHTVTTSVKLTFANVANTVKNAIKTLLGIQSGGIISRSGKLTRFANGGSIMRNGRASWWDSVNKYAAGTSRAHGTVFVAGEAGPEIMGHVNGRTEILNKSQLADAMYGAVVSGMAGAVNALGVYLANHMTTCTNSIVQTIGANSITALAGMNYYQPTMANGGIMPYDVAMQIARSTQELQHTLDANNEDLIQALVSAMGNAANSIITAMQRNQNIVNQRRAGSGNGIDDINRTTLMYGKSPLKGV